MKIVLKNSNLVFSKYAFVGNLDLYNQESAGGPVKVFYGEGFYKSVDGVIQRQISGNYKSFIIDALHLSSVTGITTSSVPGIGIFCLSSINSLTPIGSFFKDASDPAVGQVKTISNTDFPIGTKYVLVNVLKNPTPDYGDVTTQGAIYVE